MERYLIGCPCCGKRADVYRHKYTNCMSEIFEYAQVGCMPCGIFMSTRHYEMQHPDAELELEKDLNECIKSWNTRYYFENK